MSTNLTNFRLWYSRILTHLSTDGDAEFVILITAFPLLERYLREKSGVHEGNLDIHFYSELLAVFPALKDADQAKKFWHVYRNGLLHQVTFSQGKGNGVRMPDAWISSQCDMLKVESNGDFWVHPGKFASEVVKLIEGDFATFEGAGSANHTLPSIHASGPNTSSAQLVVALPATGAMVPPPPGP